MGVGLNELARRIGRDKGQLSRMAKAGRIPRLEDGTFDEEVVRQIVAGNTDPARRKPLTPDQHATPGVVSSTDDARAAISLIARVLQEEGGREITTVDFDAARTAETILKTRERALNIELKQQRLVPADQVAKYVSDQFVKFKQAAQRIPARFGAQLAGELGCDPHQLDAALSKVIASVLNELSTPHIRSAPVVDGGMAED